jgi:hypothetical protein
MSYLKKLKIQLVKGDFKNRIKGQVRDPGQVYEVFKSIKDWAQETLIGVYMSETLEVSSPVEESSIIPEYTSSLFIPYYSKEIS